MTAATEQEMQMMGWQHAAFEHPDKMASALQMTEEQKAEGVAHFHTVWEATPEHTRLVLH